MTALRPLESAQLQWRGTAPYSTLYDDIFFDRDDAFAEARYVFLEGNDLPRRWQGRHHFTIAETGFGTGLNFLATVQVWRASAAADARLHYVAVEKHPLSPADLAKALSPWSSLQPWVQALVAAYPQRVAGFHRLDWVADRVSLTLLFGDAGEMLAQLQARVDAWYLDGFAPSRNAAMWSADVFRQVARLSAPAATFSTFTAAGVVRRGLADVGFEVGKRPGFGKKRDMLHGRFAGTVCATPEQPWFAPARPVSMLQRYAIVVGAGVAGCCVAYALAARGWQVDVVDRHDGVAYGASGNPAGVVLPRLTADMNAEGRFYLAAFLYASRWFDGLNGVDAGVGWRRSGVLQLADMALMARLTALGLPESVVTGLDEYGARGLSGVAVRGPGLHFGLGGWLPPQRLCALLLRCFPDNVRFLPARNVVGLKFCDGLWRVGDGRREIGMAPVVILAGGPATVDHVDALFALQAVRGQLTYAAATPASRGLALPVCYDGYVIPELDGRHCVGATFDRDNGSGAVSGDDNRKNMAALSRRVAGLGLAKVVGARVSFRAATLDHLPVCGPVPDVGYYHRNYAELRHGPRARRFPDAVYRPGLFVTAGHGARGLVSCPLSATMIAAMLDDEPLPLPLDMLASLHPARFLIRDIIKGV